MSLYSLYSILFLTFIAVVFIGFIDNFFYYSVVREKTIKENQPQLSTFGCLRHVAGAC